jgi:hypothetical protein
LNAARVSKLAVVVEVEELLALPATCSLGGRSGPRSPR